MHFDCLSSLKIIEISCKNLAFKTLDIDLVRSINTSNVVTASLYIMAFEYRGHILKLSYFKSKKVTRVLVFILRSLNTMGTFWNSHFLRADIARIVLASLESLKISGLVETIKVQVTVAYQLPKRTENPVWSWTKTMREKNRSSVKSIDPKTLNSLNPLNIVIVLKTAFIVL